MQKCKKTEWNYHLSTVRSNLNGPLPFRYGYCSPGFPDEFLKILKVSKTEISDSICKPLVFLLSNFLPLHLSADNRWARLHVSRLSPEQFGAGSILRKCFFESCIKCHMSNENLNLFSSVVWRPLSKMRLATSHEKQDRYHLKFKFQRAPRKGHLSDWNSFIVNPPRNVSRVHKVF